MTEDLPASGELGERREDAIPIAPDFRINGLPARRDLVRGRDACGDSDSGPIVAASAARGEGSVLAGDRASEVGERATLQARLEQGPGALPDRVGGAGRRVPAGGETQNAAVLEARSVHGAHDVEDGDLPGGSDEAYAAGGPAARGEQAGAPQAVEDLAERGPRSAGRGGECGQAHEGARTGGLSGCEPLHRPQRVLAGAGVKQQRSHRFGVGRIAVSALQAHGPKLARA